MRATFGFGAERRWPAVSSRPWSVRGVGDAALHVRPDLLVGVQVRRVRQQIEQLQASLPGLHEILDQLGLVNRMAVKHEEDGPLRTDHQATEERSEDSSGDGSVMHHEPELALRTERRNHVQRKALAGRFHHRLAGRFHHRCAALRRPRRAGVVIRANARLVGKVDRCPDFPSLGPNRRTGFEFPLAHQRRVLLPGLVQRFLRRETQQLHDAAHARQRQLLAELPFNQRGNQRRRPQPEFELELQRTVIASSRMAFTACWRIACNVA